MEDIDKSVVGASDSAAFKNDVYVEEKIDRSTDIKELVELNHICVTPATDPLPRRSFSYKNRVFVEEDEEGFGLKELFVEAAVIDIEGQSSGSSFENVDTPKENTKRENDQNENNLVVDTELQSIFEFFEEFVSSVGTVKCHVIEEEPGYTVRHQSPSDDEYADYYCNVCMNYEGSIAQCLKCDATSCFDCLTQYIEYGVMDGKIKFECPSEGNCSKVFSDQLVSGFIKPEINVILTKNKIEAEQNPNVKTCPGCHKVVTKDAIKENAKKHTEQKSKIICSCGTSWCFACYSPWHHGLSCKQYQQDIIKSGKKALRFWAKADRKGRKTAKKCPKCRVYIERIDGCDHMYCNRCKTDFCYRCGGKHYSFGLLGDHYSTYSFLGCKYNLHPKKPILRITKRAGMATGVILISPLIFAGFTIAGICFLPYLACRKCCCK